MRYFFCFSAKNDFLSLFSRIWIKIHFPLKNPVINYFEIFVRSFADIWVSCTMENKEVSTNSFASIMRPSKMYSEDKKKIRKNKVFNPCYAFWHFHFNDIYAMVLRSRFIWITNSSDHRRVWTANILYTESLPNPLGNKATRS